MARNKIVNGVRMSLTAAEDMARDQEELDYTTKPIVPLDPLRQYSQRDIARALIDKGILTIGDLNAARS